MAVQTVRLRLRRDATDDAFGGFAAGLARRVAEADEFYDHITPESLGEDERRVHRQALAGMLWSKQYYLFDLEHWLREHRSHPLEESPRAGVRNTEWIHMLNSDVISMPDKWEYPWYAAWDLAFHTIALSMVDFDFAKDQLLLMLRSLYCHPSGQIPAYEWNFSDVNPPVHAWATLHLYKVERTLGRADLRFLERSFQGLMLNFNWWVNRKDPGGRNVFAGGFLGLDNIGIFDRSAPLPTGGSLEQADGTAWMAFYCQNMLEMALILTEHDPMYEEVAFKFLQHFMWISYAMDRVGDHQDEMWDEQDGFFYDLLRLPDGQAMRLKVRSLVGLLPLCAATVFESNAAERHPKLMELIALFRKRHPELVSHVAPTSDGFVGYKGRRLLSILNKAKLERVLAYMLDENEFLGPHGIRSVSRHHLDHPFVFHIGGQEYKVQYLPGESNTGMFGGNSNWRGPVWMPVNVILIRGLLNLYGFFGDDFKVQCPTGSGNYMTLFEVAQELSRRLTGTFLRDADGRRPVYGGTARFQDDPHWRDLILFYEYFHGDNGAGLGASHQTGWTGLAAPLLDLFGRLESRDLEAERGQVEDRLVREQVGGKQKSQEITVLNHLQPHHQGADMKRNFRSFILAGVVALSGGAAVTSTLWAQAAAETFSATASVKGPQGTMTAPVVVVIERYTTDGERSQAVEALKAGGTSALRQALEKAPAIGYIEVGQRKNTHQVRLCAASRIRAHGHGDSRTNRSGTSARSCQTPSPRQATTSRSLC